MTQIADACAVVTGAGSGIGRACALRLSRDGARLALLDRDGAGARRTLAAVEAAGGTATAFEVDVTDEPAVSGAVDAAAAAYGAPRILVNSAGIAVRKRLLDTTLEEWQRVIGVNLTGYFVVLKSVVAAMKDAGGGAIVQIASTAGHIGYGYPSYTAAKGGVLAFDDEAAGRRAGSAPDPDQLHQPRGRLDRTQPGHFGRRHRS